MYIVKCYRTIKYWERGDLTSLNVMYNVEIFKTRANAKAYIEKLLLGKKNCYRNYVKTGTSYCGYNTGNSWEEENTGEIINETYSFKMSKVVPI